MTTIPVQPTDTQLTKLLNLAIEDDIVLTRDGQPVGVLLALRDEDDHFDHALENDARFVQRIAAARLEAERGNKQRWADVK